MEGIHRDDSDSLNTSQSDLECYDPNYEFRAPMYYDFNNPNERAEDGDQWFDYHEDDLLSPLQSNKKSLQNNIHNSPFQRQTERKLIIKKPVIQSNTTKTSLKTVINKPKTINRTYTSAQRLLTIKPLKKNNNTELSKPEIKKTTMPRYLEPTKSMLYAMKQKENEKNKPIVRSTLGLVKKVNNKVSTQPKKPTLYTRIKQPTRPLTTSTHSNIPKKDISKLHSEYTLCQKLRMEQKLKVSKYDTPQNSPFRLKEEMRKHNITKCTPTTLKILREKRRKPLTIPITPEFVKRYRARERKNHMYN